MSGKIRIKYLIGFIAFSVLFIYSANKPEVYHLLIPGLMAVMAIVSAFLMFLDKEAKTYVVVDSENDKIIKSFIAEEDAIEFADNQDKDTKVVMLML